MACSPEADQLGALPSGWGEFDLFLFKPNLDFYKVNLTKNVSIAWISLQRKEWKAMEESILSTITQEQPNGKILELKCE